MSLLEIEKLTVEFPTRNGFFRAVDTISLRLDVGEVLSIVGELGVRQVGGDAGRHGPSAQNGARFSRAAFFDGHDLKTISHKERRKIIGRDMAMIFQEPATSLNPCFTVGFQIDEAMKAHLDLSRAERRARAIELLEWVGITEPERRLAAFPHQMSGGMSQRVMIAMAISCNPKLLIADEPTTALDVTIQAQILDLLVKLQKDRGMGLVLITHDMGVVAETAERVVVQYAGQQVEQATTRDLFRDPHHPYTAALLAALPERATQKILPSIPGVVPGQHDRPTGCLFAPRCAFTIEACTTAPPPPAGPDFNHALCIMPLVKGQPQRQRVLA